MTGQKTIMSRKRVFWGFIVSALALLIIVGYLNFPAVVSGIAEKTLVVNDDLIKSDVIIVISGGFQGERLEKAIDLFKKGYGRKLIFSGGLITRDTSVIDLWLERVEKMGISPCDIIQQRDATSTYEQAVFCAKIMKEKHYESALLVTSPYHSRRAKWVFMNTFEKRNFRINVVPVERPKSLMEENRARRIDIVIEEIFFELQKTLFYYIAY